MFNCRTTGLTEDAHDVLAVDLPLCVHLRTLLVQDLLAILHEETVQVPQARVRVRGQVFDQFEDGNRDVVPRRAEEYDRARGLIVDVLAAYTSVQCHPAKPATSLHAVGHLQEVIVGLGKVAAPAGIESVIVVIKCSFRAHENAQGW